MTKEEYAAQVAESLPHEQIQAAFENAASVLIRLTGKYRISEADYREALADTLKYARETFSLGATFGYQRCAQDFELVSKGEIGGELDG